MQLAGHNHLTTTKRSQALIEDVGLFLTGEPREHLEEIIRASRRMGDLIDGILALSRSSLCDQRYDSVRGRFQNSVNRLAITKMQAAVSRP